MKILHVTVESDDGWLIAQGLEEPGVITQGRTLDELLINIRDAATQLLNEKNFVLEIIVPPGAGRKGARPMKKSLSMANKLRVRRSDRLLAGR